MVQKSKEKMIKEKMIKEKMIYWIPFDEFNDRIEKKIKLVEAKNKFKEKENQILEIYREAWGELQKLNKTTPRIGGKVMKGGEKIGIQGAKRFYWSLVFLFWGLMLWQTLEMNNDVFNSMMFGLQQLLSGQCQSTSGWLTTIGFGLRQHSVCEGANQIVREARQARFFEIYNRLGSTLVWFKFNIGLTKSFWNKCIFLSMKQSGLFDDDALIFMSQMVSPTLDDNQHRQQLHNNSVFESAIEQLRQMINMQRPEETPAVIRGLIEIEGENGNPDGNPDGNTDGRRVGGRRTKRKRKRKGKKSKKHKKKTKPRKSKGRKHKRKRGTRKH